MISLLLTLAGSLTVFGQDGGEVPTGQPRASVGHVVPLATGTTATDEDGYHAVALKDLATTKWTHACTRGIVTLSKREADGDRHLRLEADGAFIVAEIIPQIPFPAPRVGQSVEVCGITRYDRAHGWPELHPVTRTPRVFKAQGSGFKAQGTSGSVSPVSIAVAPRTAFEPATFKLRITVEPHPDNRGLLVSFDGPGYLRRFGEQLDGDDAPRTRERTIENVPAGEYVIAACVHTTEGHHRCAEAQTVTVIGQEMEFRP